MALIPQNLERLNNNVYRVEVSNVNKIYFNHISGVEYFDLEFGSVEHVEEPQLVSFLSHCLRTIPEFQEPNPKYHYNNSFSGFESVIIP